MLDVHWNFAFVVIRGPSHCFAGKWPCLRPNPACIRWALSGAWSHFPRLGRSRMMLFLGVTLGALPLDRHKKGRPHHHRPVVSTDQLIYHRKLNPGLYSKQLTLRSFMKMPYSKCRQFTIYNPRCSLLRLLSNYATWPGACFFLRGFSRRFRLHGLLDFVAQYGGNRSI